jgi:hypothetical protein
MLDEPAFRTAIASAKTTSLGNRFRRVLAASLGNERRARGEPSCHRVGATRLFLYEALRVPFRLISLVIESERVLIETNVIVSELSGCDRSLSEKAFGTF